MFKEIMLIMICSYIKKKKKIMFYQGMSKFNV